MLVMLRVSMGYLVFLVGLVAVALLFLKGVRADASGLLVQNVEINPAVAEIGEHVIGYLIVRDCDQLVRDGVKEPCGPQSDVSDLIAGTLQHDPVPFLEWTVKKDHYPGEEIRQSILGCESDDKSYDAHPGYENGDVYSEHLQEHHESDYPNRHCDDFPEEGRKYVVSLCIGLL